MSKLGDGSSLLMQVTSLGHAGLSVETGGSSLYCDPWFSPEGAYQASWFPYPANEHLLKQGTAQPTAVAISHEHLDHVDPWYLARVPSRVPVIAPRYSLDILTRKVQQSGPREIIELAPWEQLQLDRGLSIFFVPEESPRNHDSAMVITAEGRTILNMNDACLSPAQLREIRSKVGGVIDLFTFQSSGASWHPMCYDYPEAIKKEISWRKRQAKFRYVAQAIKTIEPATAAPFAGPPCFLDPDLFKYNDEMEEGIFPDQQQTVDWLTSEGFSNSLLLLPGDVVDLITLAKHSDPWWGDFSLSADRLRYLSDYAQSKGPLIKEVLGRYPDPDECLWEDFRGYFNELLEMSPYFNEKISMRVGFEVSGAGGGNWAVDFRPGREGVFRDIGQCGYIYSFTSRWLPPILDRSIPWEDFFLSLRFQASREPDLFNEHLLGLLKFAAPDALASVEKWETSQSQNEKFTIHTEGRTYEVQRYCPHAGHDLSEASVLLPGRVLQCLAHQYKFDLETGECLNGACPALETALVP